MFLSNELLSEHILDHAPPLTIIIRERHSYKQHANPIVRHTRVICEYIHSRHQQTHTLTNERIHMHNTHILYLCYVFTLVCVYSTYI